MSGEVKEQHLEIRACECGMCLIYGVFVRLDNRRVKRIASWTPIAFG